MLTRRGVAFETAASLILAAHTKPAHPKLIGIVAYYPSTMPAIKTKYPPSIRVLVHLAGKEVNVTHHPEVLGIQAKTKSVKKGVDSGAGYGEILPQFSYKVYSYTGLEPGFAERDLDEYDAVAESVAFTRSLETLRKGFRIETEIETSRDEIVDLTASGAVQKAMKKVRPFAHVIHGPTLSGGGGTDNLSKFYTNFFQPLPPSFRARLLSRTIGTDGSRLVDEILITFTHTLPIPWILPGIPATNKKVEVVMVSIVRVIGGQLESEHVYWDQASVLVQVGLLSAKMVPEGFKKKGVVELPVIGAESARAMRRGGSRRLNELIVEWDDDDDGEGDEEGK